LKTPFSSQTAPYFFISSSTCFDIFPAELSYFRSLTPFSSFFIVAKRGWNSEISAPFEFQKVPFGVLKIPCSANSYIAKVSSAF